MSAKIVLTGESAVGKTSIVHYLVKGYSAGQTESTIGAAFLTLKLANGHYEIWDTAGQERYYSLMPMYYRKANIIFLVYDMTNYESFSKLQNIIKNVLDCISDRERLNVHFIIIENKIDLEDYRAVPFEQGLLFAESLKKIIPNTKFFRTSAQIGNGISDILTYLLTNYYSFQSANIENKEEKKGHVDLNSFVYEDDSWMMFWKGWCTLF